MTAIRPHARWIIALAVLAMLATLLPLAGSQAEAATPSSATLTAPATSGSASVSWSGGPYTSATPDPLVCVHAALNCDEFLVTIDAPADYWDSREGTVTFEIDWASTADDFDMYIYDETGREVDYSASGGTNHEEVVLPKLAPGTYTVQVVAWLTAAAAYDGQVTIEATQLPPDMTFPEDRDTIMDLLTVDYPLNVIFVGRTPTPEEVAELRAFVPEQYQPTVSSKSPFGNEPQNEGASLLNWNKNHLVGIDPYFLGLRYNFDLRIITASDEYAQALFQVAEDHTAQDYSFQASADRDDLVRYDNSYGHYRVLAKGGDPTFEVTDATTVDLIDAYAVEDWIFDSRHDPQWDCAFTDLETGDCYSPSIIQPQADAYHDPFYDKYGLNLDHMPQGTNQGSSFFFLDTFTPEYAADYFRPNKYHNWGTDQVIDGQIIPAPIEQGGSWRITDPDTNDWDGVDYARTWGGRYRFHFIDLGAAPNNFESSTWLRAERTLSSDYPHGDPPIWQYDADPNWMQDGEACAVDPTLADEYTGGTPCRLMPRIGRSVAYGLFFRSTAGYLYRPIPRGDVYWLAVSTWTDFYSRPQWVNGQLTSAPWYGTWWTDTEKLYKINEVGNDDDDVLRWLSSAMPYARWVGRTGEVIPLYDPTNNQPTGEVLDTSPKFEDLPAPEYHVHSSAFGSELVAEPLYDGTHHTVQYGDATVDLTEVSNAIEKAKAYGTVGFAQDFAVSHTYMRDYIDANPDGIADRVEGVNTIPSINLVFEKTYTWALPLIVGGIAVGTDDGEAWGVMNNVNDRFKWSESHYPGVQPGDEPGSKRSMTDESLPTQDTGTGFSYTIEHEAAHNLGLSHPHDGSLGVDRCEDNHPEHPGEWKCYWEGLGWMYDISAAPTTYAMAYRPYEVEDQDNLQRGHVAEYLIAAQDALRQRLIAEAEAGATSPSAGWSADFATMAEWRTQAAELFACGDYLHAEYAARNAALAARGVQQTPANTTEPRLLEAGQVFFFNVNPQDACGGGGGGNQPPTAVATADPASATVGQTVTFDGSGSSDDSTPADELTYEWDFDADGTTDATGVAVTHAYGAAGSYDARLVVTDAEGLSDFAIATVTVSAAPSGGGKVTGGGWLAADDGAKINFGFNAKTQSGGALHGKVQLNDKAAGVKIKLDTLTALGAPSSTCSFTGGVETAEFRGDGTFNGGAASFAVCVQDNGEGSNATGADLFELTCLSGCDYSTLDRGDNAIDGGNVQVHREATHDHAGHDHSGEEAPSSGEATGAETEPASESSDSNEASVLILDPVLLTDGTVGEVKTLTVHAFNAAGEPMAGADVSLSAAGTALSGVSDALGVTLFTVSVTPGATEFVATSGALSSNAVEITGIS